MQTALLVVSAFAIGAATTVILRRYRSERQNMSAQRARLRQSVADTLDTLRDVQTANQQLLAGITERDATIVAMQGEHERMTLAIVNLIKALNAANVRNAEMQQRMHVVGVEPQPGYFLATLSDGTIVGPFGRN